MLWHCTLYKFMRNDSKCITEKQKRVKEQKSCKLANCKLANVRGCKLYIVGILTEVRIESVFISNAPQTQPDIIEKFKLIVGDTAYVCFYKFINNLFSELCLPLAKMCFKSEE